MHRRGFLGALAALLAAPTALLRLKPLPTADWPLDVEAGWDRAFFGADSSYITHVVDGRPVRFLRSRKLGPNVHLAPEYVVRHRAVLEQFYGRPL